MSPFVQGPEGELDGGVDLVVIGNGQLGHHQINVAPFLAASTICARFSMVIGGTVNPFIRPRIDSVPAGGREIDTLKIFGEGVLGVNSDGLTGLGGEAEGF